ncbi:hypothetical protein EDD18DRAFT_1098852 [Armillaria luteobubalina]|uniref:Uncharacterized protein n=1 Tax=Armillaria luteobubalina TaxID=153913 RepID=A0AA39QM67_9AGAR|nr:hypothetical protein EDD18DRAFT_1098852 [Armillaria luteobubalina]
MVCECGGGNFTLQPSVQHLSYNYPTMKIKIFTTHATEMAFLLYREDEINDLHAVLEHTKSDIHRVISEDIIARKFTLNLDCIVLNLVVENAPQNICAIFMQCRFLGILRYVQSTGAAEFVRRCSVDCIVYWGPQETIIVDAVPDVEIQHVGDCCGGGRRRRVVIDAQAGAYRESRFHGWCVGLQKRAGLARERWQCEGIGNPGANDEKHRRRAQDREYDFDKGRKEGVNDGWVHRLSR